MQVKTFEDLDSWKLARELTGMTYSLTRNDPVCRDYGFCNQIQRSSVSIMSNIAEGFERQTQKEFQQFLFIARGSAGEVRSLLYVAQDQGYLNANEFEQLRALCIRISKTIWGLIKHLRSN